MASFSISTAVENCGCARASWKTLQLFQAGVPSFSAASRSFLHERSPLIVDNAPEIRRRANPVPLALSAKPLAVELQIRLSKACPEDALDRCEPKGGYSPSLMAVSAVGVVACKSVNTRLKRTFCLHRPQSRHSVWKEVGVVPGASDILGARTEPADTVVHLAVRAGCVATENPQRTSRDCSGVMSRIKFSNPALDVCRGRFKKFLPLLQLRPYARPP